MNIEMTRDQAFEVMVATLNAAREAMERAESHPYTNKDDEALGKTLYDGAHAIAEAMNMGSRRPDAKCFDR